MGGLRRRRERSCLLAFHPVLLVDLAERVRWFKQGVASVGRPFYLCVCPLPSILPHLIDDGGISSVCVFDIDRSRRRPYLWFLVWEIILTERIWLSRIHTNEKRGRRGMKCVLTFASVCCVRHVVGAGRETTRIHCDHHHYHHHPSVMCRHQQPPKCSLKKCVMIEKKRKARVSATPRKKKNPREHGTTPPRSYFASLRSFARCYCIISPQSTTHVPSPPPLHNTHTTKKSIDRLTDKTNSSAVLLDEGVGDLLRPLHRRDERHLVGGLFDRCVWVSVADGQVKGWMAHTFR